MDKKLIIILIVLLIVIASGFLLYIKLTNREGDAPPFYGTAKEGLSPGALPSLNSSDSDNPVPYPPSLPE